MTGFFSGLFARPRTTFFGTPVDDTETLARAEGPPSAADDSSSLTPEQLAMTAVLPRPTTPANTPERRAQVILGETAGLYPRSIDPTRPPHDPANWVDGSADDLATARRYVGIVAGRNIDTKSATPDLSKSLERKAWDAATTAANAAHENPDELDPRITNFYMRGGDDKRDP